METTNLALSYLLDGLLLPFTAVFFGFVIYEILRYVVGKM